MKRFILSIILMFCASTVYAELNVVAAYPYIADIAKRMGGDRVRVKSLAPGTWDPHYVIPKPSLIAKVRNADLLIMNGAELEIGWLPPVVRDSRNARIQQGTPGFLDLSSTVKLIDVPEKVSREQGDVHPSGNPHFGLDPVYIPHLARTISERLCTLDTGNSIYYRKNYEKFARLWAKKLAEWGKTMAKMKGVKVIQYHKLYNYFLKRYGLVIVSEIEPLPGIPPTTGHIKKILDLAKKEKVSLILTDVYHSKRPARFISERTRIPVVVVPHDVGAVKEAGDVVSLFNEIVRRIAR